MDPAPAHAPERLSIHSLARPSVRATLFSILLTLPACGDPFAAGVHAYQQERFADALAAFTECEAAAGDAAPATLLVNRSLAALRAGELRVAEFSAEKAAARGGSEFVPLRDFLLGNAAFARCALAQAEAGLAEADPTAFTRAIARAGEAHDWWQRAAMSSDDWPAARRNVERAARKLDELRTMQAEAERQRQAKKERAPEQRTEQPPPDAPRTEQESEQDLAAQTAPDDLPADQLARLLATLEAKEQEKRALRRDAQRAAKTRVERDW